MEKDVIKRLACLFCIFLSIPFAFSQQEMQALERQMSLSLSGETLKETLQKMETIGGFTFAYRTNMVEPSHQLNRSYTNQSVREILDDLFQGGVSYKSKGNYVILTKKNSDESMFSLSGYVIDAQTKKKIPFVTVFDTSSLASAVSDEYGYYELSQKKRNEYVITTRKIGYRDTNIVIPSSGVDLVNITMYAIQDTIQKAVGTNAFAKRWQKFKIFGSSEKQKANIENFNKPLSQRWQVSLFPYIGSNGKLSASTKVNTSLNVLGGVNGGVEGFELGGLFNAVWDSVSGVQIAGIANFVLGNVSGFQVGGIANVNNGKTYGQSIAGITNLHKGKVNGLQLSGFHNLASAGVNGMQMAGFINQAKDTVRGIQIAGFINKAHVVQGVQISFLNISDSISGVPLGFFSYVKKGYHVLEVSANEVFTSNLAFKTGNHSLYNTFLVGVDLTPVKNLFWSCGYGLGSSVGISKRSRMFFDAQALNIQEAQEPWSIQLINKFIVSYQFALTKKMAISTGGSVNLALLSDYNSADRLLYDRLTPQHTFYDKTTNGIQRKAWLGWQVALRFF